MSSPDNLKGKCMTEKKTTTLGELIESRQRALGLSDEQVARALGYDRGIVVVLMKQGSLKLPINKVELLAEVLTVDGSEVLRCALSEQIPELMQVIDRTFGPFALSPTERSLITHVRKISAGREARPVVIDGTAVIALLTV
jgi:transcriptional regulator with XRE-family HTH domain